MYSLSGSLANRPQARSLLCSKFSVCPYDQENSKQERE